MTDKAIDNLWIAKTDYIGGSLPTTPYATVLKDPNNVYNNKNSKVEGVITYVKIWGADPKTGRKVPVGFQRYLKGVIGRYNYFDPNLFEPYYENIKNNPSKYAPDLIALADKKMNDSSFTGSNMDLGFDGQRNMDIEQSEIDLGADGNRWVWDGLRWKVKIDPKSIDKKLSFEGEGGNEDWRWIERPIELIDSNNSIYTGGNICEIDVNNMECMDDSFTPATCGENIDVMKNYKAPKISNFNGMEQSSNVSGVNVADPSKSELTADEMNALYKKSGSKKSFGDWYATKGKGNLDSLSNLVLSANSLFGKQKEGKAMEKKLSQDSGSNSVTDNSVTILGMHPVTFSIFALLSLTVIGVVGYKILNKTTT